MGRLNKRLLPLCESAILLALSFVLSLFTIFTMPNGGSVTFASMLPVILIGVRWGPLWGFGSGLVFGLLKLLQGIHAITPMAIVLDYFLAYGVLGFSGFFKGKKYGLIPAAAICGFLRFVVHWFSGVTVWASTTPEGMPVWYYSLTYNITYMLPEIVFAVLVAVVICVPIQRLWLSKGAIKG